jgi:hypothetical protein
MRRQLTSLSMNVGKGLMLALMVFGASACFSIDRNLDGLDCTPEGNCKEGFVCQQGKCITANAVADDGGQVADAGSIPDAGSVSDSGPVSYAGLSSDAGVAMDAGPADAGPIDGGGVDSGAADAGPIDSGSSSAMDGGAICGNGVIEVGEDCDLGPLANLDVVWGCDGCIQDPLATCVGEPSFCAESARRLEVGSLAHSSIQDAINAANDGDWILVQQGWMEGTALEILTGQLTVVGLGNSTITPNGGGTAFDVKGDADLVLVRMRIRHLGNGGERVIQVRDDSRVRIFFSDIGPGPHQCIDANADTPVEVTAMYNRIHDCAQGGVTFDANDGGFYDLRHNFIYSNGTEGDGGVASSYGGLFLQDGTGIFRFNTVAENKSDWGQPAGMRCNGSQHRVTDSIFWNNGGDSELGSSCQAHTGRNFIHETGWSDNLAVTVVDPLFESSPTNLRLQSASPLKDQAMAGDEWDEWDIDADQRPQGIAHDVGADEVFP